MLALLLITLTAWRLARLVCKDDFPPSAKLRQRVIEWAGTGSVWHYLVECIPCVGVYTSGVVTAAVVSVAGLPMPFLYWGGAAALVVLTNDGETLVERLAESTDDE